MIAYRVRRPFDGGALGEFRVGEFLDAEGFRALKNGRVLVETKYLELKDTGDADVTIKTLPTSTPTTPKPSKGTKRAGRRT